MTTAQRIYRPEGVSVAHIDVSDRTQPEQGWEHELSEDSAREIAARRREYRDNCPQYPTRVTLARVRLDGVP